MVGALISLAAVRVAMMVLMPLSDTTEARYAEIARKMVETGDWITPQFDYGIPFWGKPPLHTWLSAAGMGGLGPTEFGARSLIFLSALTILLVIFFWVRSCADVRSALATVVVLSSTVLFFGASGFVMTDIPMTLGVVLCMTGFFQCVTKANATWGRLAFLGLAIGLLAKGPVAAVLCLLSIGMWLLTTKRLDLLRILPWRSGLFILLIVALPWFVIAELKTLGFLKYFLIGEHFERFVVPDWQGDLYGSGHREPKGIIWLYGMAAFMPWTLFGFALLPRARAIALSFRSDEDRLLSFLVFWALSPLVLFTPAANILAAYTLPGLPAAACLGVLIWRDVGLAGPLASAATVIAVVFTASLGTALLVANSLQPNHKKWRSERTLVATLDKIAPSTDLTYFQIRSYSAEYYRSGQVTVARSLADLQKLKQNTNRDAIAAGEAHRAQIDRWARPEFQIVGNFGRHTLFIETVDAAGSHE